MSSINVLRVGPKAKDGEEIGGGKAVEELGIEEGGEGDGKEVREGLGVPETANARKKWFLSEENKKKWEWERGRVYWGDFFNPYLDFNGSSPPYFALTHDPTKSHLLTSRTQQTSP